VKELKDDDIKEGVNEETKTSYRYFALEGVDKGSEIEYLMVIGKNADYHGEQAVLQGEIPKRNLDFKIITPGNLIFKTKSYNKLPDLQVSTTPEGKNVLYVRADTIAGLKDEPFAVYTPHLMQLVYKLDENKNTGQKNLINNAEAAQTIYELTHEQLDRPTLKSLQKLIKQTRADEVPNLEEKIRKVENYIKSNFNIIENTNFKDIASIMEYKTSDEVGTTKLYTAIFDELQINYQVVLTSNRYTLRFDPDFDAYNFLVAYLLYFPGLNKFLCPGSISHRLDCIPYGYTYNYGLFVKNVTLGDFKSGVGEVSFIEADSFTKNKHNIIVKADFSKSFGNPDLYFTILLGGQYAQTVQPYYSYIPQERQEEMNNTILKNIIKDAKFTDIQVENKGAENLGLKPLIIKARFNSPTIVEQAGDKYLFKIGDLIGPQVELYQEEERKFDVENDFNRSYYREITFDIPEGYKVNNLDALKLNVAMMENGEASSYFVSNYEIINNKTVVVKVNEDYKSIFYPKERFQDYRKVVNASADFNKVVILFEKK
jgi:hypothetical protein